MDVTKLRLESLIERVAHLNQNLMVLASEMEKVQKEVKILLEEYLKNERKQG